MKSSIRLKKAFLIVLCGVFSMSGIAQITIVQNGNVGVGTSNPVSKFAVNDSGNSNYAIHARSINALDNSIAIRAYTNTPSPASTNYLFQAIYGNLSCGNGWSKGVTGYSSNVSAQSSGRAYGVYGLASNATPGYNYGVFGILSGSNNGAGIYGASRGNSDEDTQGNYAGYFKGNVYMSNLLSIGNKNTTYAVDVTGTVRATAYLTSSDARLKEDINDIDDSPISSLKQVRGVNYLLKAPVDKSSSSKSKHSADTTEVNVNVTAKDTSAFKRRHNGFLAQEVQQIYPELVYEDGEGMLSIDYIGFIPIIVEALKEQDKTIALQASEIKELKAVIEANGDQSSSTLSSKAILYQNSPNPFNTSTSISCFIPENSKSAEIYIFNMQGTLITKKKISSTGDTSITINASDLKAGMYLYSLIVDSKEVDSKRMILTD